MSLFSISLLTACTAMRLVRVNVPKVLKFSLVSAGLLLVVVVGVRQSVSMMLSEDSILAQALLETSLEGSDPITEQAITARQELPEDPTTPPPSPLQDIFERGTLRVGFFPENLPFSFYNNKRELIGFDVELLTVLAHELNVRLEFVPWEYESLFEDLADHKFDVVIGGMIVNPERLAKASFSEPYLNITTSVVVEDFQRHAFETWSDIDRAAGVRLGVVGEKRAAHMRAMLPNTEVVTLSSYEDFFEQNTSNATAMVISAEAGSAYTTVYPSHSVVVPEPHMKAHMALFFPPGESDFRDLVDDWLRLKKTSGLVDRLYNKWILGKTEERYRVRWSIGRDVLGLWE